LEKSTSARIRLPAGIETQALFGHYDDHLKRIEEALHVRLTARGDEITIHGSSEAVKGAERLLLGLVGIMNEGFVLRPQDVQYAIQAIHEDPAVSIKGLFLDAIPIATKKRMVVPRSGTQRSYVDAVGKYDLVIAIGPAGTGKRIWPWPWPFRP